jgi:protein TonB
MFSFSSRRYKFGVRTLYSKGIAFPAELISLPRMRSLICILASLILIPSCAVLPDAVVPGLFETQRSPFMPQDDYPVPPNVERMMSPEDCKGATLTAIEANIPEYPLQAWNGGRQGWVVVKFHVYSDGSVHRARVLRSVPGGSFNQSSTRAVSQWRFAPLQGVDSLSNCVVMFEYRAGEVRIR